MSSAICFNLDKFKILLSGNGLIRYESPKIWHLLSKTVYYIPVTFLAQIQVSHMGEIPHDRKKNPYLHSVKYGSKYGIDDIVH